MTPVQRLIVGVVLVVLRACLRAYRRQRRRRGRSRYSTAFFDIGQYSLRNKSSGLIQRLTISLQDATRMAVGRRAFAA